MEGFIVVLHEKYDLEYRNMSTPMPFFGTFGVSVYHSNVGNKFHDSQKRQKLLKLTALGWPKDFRLTFCWKNEQNTQKNMGWKIEVCRDWHWLSIKIPLCVKKWVIFKPEISPEVGSFTLRPWSNKSSQEFLRNLSLRIERMSRRVAFSRFFGSVKIPMQGTKLRNLWTYIS